jgi:glycosyltransferase involved in cell wall biosynthesis
MKILLTIRQGEVGGGETHLLSLLEHLNRSFYQPVVLSFSKGVMVDRVEAMGIKCHVIHSKSAFDFKVSKKVYAFLKGENIDIIHAHGTRAYTNVIIQALSLSIPVIYTVHGWSFHNDQNIVNKYLRISIERLLIKNARRTILVSGSNKETGKKLFKNSDFAVIPNGVDLLKFNRNDADSVDIRKEFGIPSSAFLVGFIARVTKQKDPLGMIEGFQLAKQHCPNLYLLMVGDGDLKDKAMQKVKKLGLESQVFFDGFRQDVPEILRSIDVYCLPSLWEGLPIGLIEAMAVSKAVIATNVDGSKDVIHHSENGLLVEPASPYELSRAITKLYHDRQLKSKLELSARTTIVNHYDITKSVKETEQVYGTTIN